MCPLNMFSNQIFSATRCAMLLSMSSNQVSRPTRHLLLWGQKSPAIRQVLLLDISSFEARSSMTYILLWDTSFCRVYTSTRHLLLDISSYHRHLLPDISYYHKCLPTRHLLLPDISCSQAWASSCSRSFNNILGTSCCDYWIMLYSVSIIISSIYCLLLYQCCVNIISVLCEY